MYQTRKSRTDFATTWAGKNFGVYDVFWTLSSFRDELRQNGFQLARFEPVGVNIQVYEGQLELEEECWHMVSFEKLRRESDPNHC